MRITRRKSHDKITGERRARVAISFEGSRRSVKTPIRNSTPRVACSRTRGTNMCDGRHIVKRHKAPKSAPISRSHHWAPVCKAGTLQRSSAAEERDASKKGDLRFGGCIEPGDYHARVRGKCSRIVVPGIGRSRRRGRPVVAVARVQRSAQRRRGEISHRDSRGAKNKTAGTFAGEGNFERIGFRGAGAGIGAGSFESGGVDHADPAGEQSCAIRGPEGCARKAGAQSDTGGGTGARTPH